MWRTRESHAVQARAIPRLGLVLPYLKSRGTERQALALGKHFKQRGWDVLLFVLEPWGDFQYAFQQAGLRVIPCQSLAEAYPRRDGLRATRALARAIRSEPVDLLLSRAGMTNMACAVAGRMTGTPTIIVQSGPVREPTWARALRARAYWRNWMTYGLATRVVPVSSVGAERLRTIWWPFRSRIVAIRNGVDFAGVTAAAAGEPPQELGSARTPRTWNVGYVGSLDTPRKGLDVLFDAFARLELPGRDPRLWLVGSGWDEASLRERATRLGIAGRTHFVGERHDPYAWIRAFDVFVLPSRREGLPNALMEAMALGRCCIAADCPTGPSELIESGRDGILVRVGDVDALVDALRRACEDPDQAAVYGRRAREKMKERFRSVDTYDAYEALGRELVGR